MSRYPTPDQSTRDRAWTRVVWIGVVTGFITGLLVQATTGVLPT